MPHSESSSSSDERPARRGVYLLTHPRCASNLFQTMMSKQYSGGKPVQDSGYYLFGASFEAMMAMAKGPWTGPNHSEADREALLAKYQEAFGKLEAEIADAQSKGSQVFIKEHCVLMAGPDRLFSYYYEQDRNIDKPFVALPSDGSKPTHTNPTCVPDEFLQAMQPIFQIRHPIRMFPSYLRTNIKSLGQVRPSDPRMAATLNLKPSRALFEWYRDNDRALPPKVLDADDVMKDRAAIRQLCEEIDFDPEAVQYEWGTREEKDPLIAAFKSTISGSTGILPGLAARELVLDDEVQKWKEEFGEEDAEFLKKMVQEAMPDYEFLYKQRVQGKQ